MWVGRAACDAGLLADDHPPPDAALEQTLADLLAGGSYRTAPGQLGRFSMRELLARSATTVVITADDPTRDREIVLQLIRPPRGDPHALARRIRDALVRLNHPNIVKVLEVGVLGGYVYVAMRRIHGQSLAAWMQGERSWRRALPIFKQAALGLFAIHRRGHVHCDFTPRSLLIGPATRLHPDGHVRLIDLAKIRPAGNPTPIRTPPYTAPEVLRGEPVDARADQYSFCAVFFEAIYGAPPFAGQTPSELTQAIAAGRIAAAPPDSDAPPKIHDVLGRGLHARPEARWRDLMALLEAIDRADPEHALARPTANPGPLAASVWLGILLLNAVARACS